MPGNYETIKSYLVGLGFAVDDLSARKFAEALKRTAVSVDKFVDTSAKGFAVVGGAFVTATAAVAGATVGLMSSVAKQDLGFQILARRMLMTTEATRKMKLATDALGYSLPEILFGPPELRERYNQLIQDQTRMLQFFGSDQGEHAFRTIRDIQFQFTRMGPALQMFGMRLTEDIINKLTGTPMSLENRLKQFVDWFEGPSGFVRISDKISGVIVPAFNLLAKAASGVWSGMFGSSTDPNAPVTKFGLNTLGTALPPTLGNMNTLAPNKGLWETLKSTKPSTWAGLWDTNKSVAENLRDLLGTNSLTRNEIIGDIIKRGKTSGHTAMLLALAQQESSFNPGAVESDTGAFGLGQILPQNWPRGLTMSSPEDQIKAMDQILTQNLARHHGNLREALNDYYGHGKPRPGQPTFDQYYDQFMQKYQRWQTDPSVTGKIPGVGWSGSGDPSLRPQAYNSGDTHVTVHIERVSATADEVRKAVREGVAEADKERARRMITRAQGAYV